MPKVKKQQNVHEKEASEKTSMLSTIPPSKEKEM